MNEAMVRGLRGSIGSVALGGGILLLILGQIALDESIQIRFDGDPLSSWLRSPVLPMFMPGIVGLVSGALLFGLGARLLGGGDRSTEEEGVPALHSERRRRIGFGLCGLGLVLSIALSVHAGLSIRNDWNPDLRALLHMWVRPGVFLLAIACGGFGSALLASRRYPRLPFDLFDLLAMVAFACLFVAATMPTLEHWRFSYVGDEFAFYQVAYDLYSGRTFDFLWQAGVYSTHPLVSSWIPAMSMRVFGNDILGWKLGLVAIGVLISVLTYLAGRWVFDRPTALVATGVTATAHYYYAYTHTGHNNIDAVPPVISVILFALLGLRRPTPLLWFLAGAAAGGSLFFFFAARIAGPILALSMLQRGRRHFLGGLGPASLGCAIVMLPFLARNQGETVTRMLVESAGIKPGGPMTVAAEAASLTLWSALAFHWSSAHGLYLSLGLLDPISALFSLAGVGLAIFRFGDYRRRTLVLAYLLILILAGGLARHSGISVPRLLIAVPVLALLAGDAVRSFLATVGWLGARADGARRAASGVLLIALLVALAFVNIYRFQVQTPARNETAPEAMAIAALYDERCSSAGESLLIWSGRAGAIVTMLAAHDPDGYVPMIVTQEEFLAVPAYQRWPCVVLPHSKTPVTSRVIAAVRQASPHVTMHVVTDDAGARDAVILRTERAEPPPGRPGDRLYALGATDTRRGGAPAALQEITDISRGAAGNWFVGDRGNRRIAEFSPQWHLIRHWGDGVLNDPIALAAPPDGGLVVLDAGLRAIVRFDVSARVVVRVSWGTFGLVGPRAILVAGDGFQIADRDGATLLRLDRDLAEVGRPIVPTSPRDRAMPLRVSSLALLEDQVLAYDATSGRVRRLTLSGSEIAEFATDYRDGVVAASPDGRIWLGGAHGRPLARFTVDGQPLGEIPPTAIAGGTGEGGVAALAFDDQGDVVIGWRYLSVFRYREFN